LARSTGTLGKRANRPQNHAHTYFFPLNSPKQGAMKGRIYVAYPAKQFKSHKSFSSIANKIGPTWASGSFSITFPPHSSSDRKSSSCASGSCFLLVPGCRTATPIRIFVHRFICARDTGMSRRLSNMALSSMWNSLCTIIVKVTGFVTSSLTRRLGDRMRSFPTQSVVSAFLCVSFMWLRQALTWGAMNFAKDFN